MVTRGHLRLVVGGEDAQADLDSAAQQPQGAAIIPLGEGATDSDPLRRLLVSPESLTLHWDDRPGSGWNVRQSLRAGGASAAALSSVALAVRAGASSGSGTLYRAIIPAGQQLMASSKMAGAFIGATTVAGAKGITGASILVPASAAGMAAAAPVVALVALTAGLAYLAERDQQRRLEEIRAAVAGVRRELDLERVSRLQGAELALQQVEMALLDDPGVVVEQVVPGFGSAGNHVRGARARGITLLTRWRKTVEDADRMEKVRRGWLVSPSRLGPLDDRDRAFLLDVLETDRAFAAHQRLAALQNRLVHGLDTPTPMVRLLATLERVTAEDEEHRRELRELCYRLPRLRLDSPDAIHELLNVSDSLGADVNPVQGVVEKSASVAFQVHPDGTVDLMERRRTSTG